MSKIGRKPISCGNVQVDIKNNIVTYKGKESAGEYCVPGEFEVIAENNTIALKVKESYENRANKDINMIWGLHRALLNNAITGAHTLFSKELKIEGLGFKVEQQGQTLTFYLGFSHKINYLIPAGVFVEIDKTKQNITLKSAKKDLLGHVASIIKAFRPVEPYKGKGIYYSNEKVFRKAGKTKSK
jgi:large subunit ribosomal protein L6